MRTAAPLSLSLLAAIVVLVAGCGGGGGGAAHTHSAVRKNTAYSGSKAEFAAALNRICAPVRKQIRDLHLTDMRVLAGGGDKALALISAALDRIGRLQPPKSINAQVDEFLSTAREEEGKLADLVQAIQDVDVGRAQRIGVEASRLAGQADAAAKAIGATRCAQNQ